MNHLHGTAWKLVMPEFSAGMLVDEQHRGSHATHALLHQPKHPHPHDITDEMLEDVLECHLVPCFLEVQFIEIIRSGYYRTIHNRYCAGQPRSEYRSTQIRLHHNDKQITIANERVHCSPAVKLHSQHSFPHPQCRRLTL